MKLSIPPGPQKLLTLNIRLSADDLSTLRDLAASNACTVTDAVRALIALTRATAPAQTAMPSSDTPSLVN